MLVTPRSLSMLASHCSSQVALASALSASEDKLLCIVSLHSNKQMNRHKNLKKKIHFTSVFCKTDVKCVNKKEEFTSVSLFQPMWNVYLPHQLFKGPDVKSRGLTTSPLFTSVQNRCEKSFSPDVKTHFCSSDLSPNAETLKVASSLVQQPLLPHLMSRTDYGDPD
jgi:hypothetical protein